MEFRDRITGAWSLLSGRGSDSAVCSFCGKNRHGVEAIIQGPGATSICNRCVFVCDRVLMEHSSAPRFHRAALGAHEKSVHLPLYLEEVSLTETERGILPKLVEAFVQTLPETELIGWEYFTGEGRFDLLSVEVVTNADISKDGLWTLAVEHWQAIRNIALDALASDGDAPPDLARSIADFTKVAADLASALREAVRSKGVSDAAP